MKNFVIVMCFMLSFMSCEMNNKEASIKPYDDLSFQTEVNKYKKAYEYFCRDMTEGEIINIWYQLFKDTTYKVDGDGKDNFYDCYGSVYWFFKTIGANIINENIELMSKRVRKFRELNQITVYKDGKKSEFGGYDGVRRGSVIIFYNPRLATPWHIGLIFGKGNGIIKYCEVTGWTGGYNYGNVVYDADNVYMIFFPSWQFFIGNLFQKAFTDK
jgi:hypothetical protein